MKIIFHKDGTKTVIDKVPSLGRDRFNELDKRINRVREITERVEKRIGEKNGIF